MNERGELRWSDRVLPLVATVVMEHDVQRMNIDRPAGDWTLSLGEEAAWVALRGELDRLAAEHAALMAEIKREVVALHRIATETSDDGTRGALLGRMDALRDALPEEDV